MSEKPEFSFNGLGKTAKLFGRKPGDLLLSFFVVVVAFGITQSLFIGLSAVIVAAIFTKKARNRTLYYFRSVVLFLMMKSNYKVALNSEFVYDIEKKDNTNKT